MIEVQATGRPGFLLVLEGIDGAGKSTLQRSLAEWCRGRGHTVATSREPTSGPHGKKLRESAMTGRKPPEEELELFIADRREHVRDVIAPALARGEIVLLDRYYFSTAAYQGARGLDPEAIIAANEAFAPTPDLVLLLDLDPASGCERIHTRGSRPDGFEDRAYLDEVRRIFRAIARPYFHRLDASRAPEEVAATAQALLAAVLAARA
jgi:dTMP kinase